MSKNRIRFYVSLAIVFAVFSVIAFVVLFKNNAAKWTEIRVPEKTA